MKRWTWMTIWVLALLPLTAAQADHRVDWDAWFAGEVDVRVSLKRGEGSVFQPGEPVRIEFKANEDAYHMVYGIDTEGYVRLLFPRYWEDDGWVKAGRKVRLSAEDLAWPADRWGSAGIVYIEAIASPTPFDFHAAGLVREASTYGWYDNHRMLRVDGDPFLAFNDIHRRLFPDWDNAVFAVDYTHFYVGDYYEAPRYLNYGYRRVYVRPPHSGVHIGVRFGWSWEFGYGHCRPVYARYYVPGVHYVHHNVYHHHHVAYRHTHRRYGHYGHYGYRDGWHGTRYRVVHDTKHRRRITKPPERKRHRSVVSLHEQLERKAKRRAAVHAPETRKRDRRAVGDVVQRERSKRVAESARKRLAERGTKPRREATAPRSPHRQAADAHRRAPRKDVADAPRRGARRESPQVDRRSQRRAPAAAKRAPQASRREVKPRAERGAQAAVRERGVKLDKRANKKSTRGTQAAKRAERPRRSKQQHVVESKKSTTRQKDSSVVRSKGKPRSKAQRAKGSERKESERSARKKQRAQRK